MNLDENKHETNTLSTFHDLEGISPLQQNVVIHIAQLLSSDLKPTD